MKTISDQDLKLIVEKLPMILRHISHSNADTATVNAARRLSLMARKLNNKYKINDNDKKRNHRPSGRN